VRKEKREKRKEEGIEMKINMVRDDA